MTKAQYVIELEPLFDCPVVPEELPSLIEKSDYFIEHFWEPFDFKKKASVDQYALNEAFKVYISPFRWATPHKVYASVDKLLNNISKNSTLQLQFATAAEENLYGPRADFWMDDIYLKFITPIIKNKKIRESKRNYYSQQLQTLQNSKIGMIAPTFEFIDTKGNKAKYFPMSTPTIIVFGDPFDTDWRLARLKAETNNELSQALQQGKLNILFILPSFMQGWENEVGSYSSYWVTGYGDDLEKQIDIRLKPTIYVIGADGKIIRKNVSFEEAISAILDELAN